MSDANVPDSIEFWTSSTTFSSVVVIVATTTMPSLLLGDVLFISNSTDELDTPRAFATEFVKSVFELHEMNKNFDE